MKNGKKSKKNKFLGHYEIIAGETLTGELKLREEKTFLRVYSNERASVEMASHVKGTAYTGESLTLVDCISQSQIWGQSTDGRARYQADLLPHYVAIGRYHLSPETACITKVEFAVTDIYELFYDFDAFSRTIDADPIIDTVLQERRKTRPIERGAHPIISYYTGKSTVIEVPTCLGKLSVQHRPTSSLGGPRGVYIKNRMIIEIEPEQPVTFSEIMNRIYGIGCFLSILAGRAQGVKHIRLRTTDSHTEFPSLLSIYPCFPWKTGSKGNYYKPHIGDIPLNPVHQPQEYCAALSNWLERHKTWHTARWRYLGCIRKGSAYDFDRLVAAANMFDILPAEAVPLETTLSPDLLKAKNDCRAIFRKLPDGADRSSILGALGRMGQHSLPKKVAHRVAIVDAELGPQLPNLAFAAAIAVKLRNYFVHGSLDGLDYDKISPFLAFLTDTLEFVFSASDLIESGWNAKRWATELHGHGHSFSRYISEFRHIINELRRSTEPDPM